MSATGAACACDARVRGEDLENGGACGADGRNAAAFPCVLVVDDEHLNRYTLEKMLTGEGFGVLLAANGPEGRALAQRHRPDLILLDIMMPGESGLETLTKLKADHQTASTPVILLSALTDVETKVRGLDLGAVDYVTKPFEFREVLARIRNSLKLVAAYETVIAAQAERLNQVRDAQQAILVRPEDMPLAGFAVSYQPVLEAGGDFYDVIPVGDGHGYFVADISGHDLKASFVTAGLKALVRQNSGPLYTPAETLIAINRVLGHVLPSGVFLTACYLTLNGRRNRITYFSCGHPPGVLVPASGGEPRLLETPGDILGVFESVTLLPLSMAVEPGDRVYLYTDGLVEDPARGGLFEGMERLGTACGQARGLPLPQAVEHVRQVVCDGRAMCDDAVLLAVEA